MSNSPQAPINRLLVGGFLICVDATSERRSLFVEKSSPHVLADYLHN
ncbi:MAG: hypothetical protein KME11_03295 [Timaviella obliquedivisa GSE-PSE-MK23-08B]|nr:hypothetical protein [Timaviella obliquedivisa GSE-PSE-MK23-08B]